MTKKERKGLYIELNPTTFANLNHLIHYKSLQEKRFVSKKEVINELINEKVKELEIKDLKEIELEFKEGSK